MVTMATVNMKTLLVLVLCLLQVVTHAAPEERPVDLFSSMSEVRVERDASQQCCSCLATITSDGKVVVITRYGHYDETGNHCCPCYTSY